MGSALSALRPRFLQPVGPQRDRPYAYREITLAAPFHARDGDIVGLASGVARISPRLRWNAVTLLRSGAGDDPVQV